MPKFYHSIPGSSSVLPSGRVVAFNYDGEMDVAEDDKEAIEFFSAIADKRGTLVVSSKEAAIPEQTAKQAAEEVKAKAAKVVAEAKAV